MAFGCRTSVGHIEHPYFANVQMYIVTHNVCVLGAVGYIERMQAGTLPEMDNAQ